MPALSLTKLSLHTGVKAIVSFMAGWCAIVLKTPESLWLISLLALLYSLCLVETKTVLKTLMVLVSFSLIYLGLVQLLAQIPSSAFMFRASPSQLLIPFFRMFITLSASLPLAFSTPISLLTKELNRLRLPLFIILPLSVAIRFLPTFFSNIKQIRDINTLRFGGTPLWIQMLRPVRFWRTFCVPLIFSSLHSSDALALSSTLKGVGTKGGLKMIEKQRLGALDWFVLSVWVGCLWGAYSWQTYVLSTVGASYVH